MPLVVKRRKPKIACATPDGAAKLTFSGRARGGFLMKNRWSFLALGFVGILALTPGCGDDEGTGDGGDGGGGNDDRCETDDDCSGDRICVDNLRGDGDEFCEEGETCSCVGAGQGGSGGSSGSSSGGSSGATLGGTGGTGGSTTTSALGEPCASDADCDDRTTCLMPDGLPSGDGPPNGLCTAMCASDDECLELASSAYCVGFEADENDNPISYCILGCVGGERGAPKCRERDDFGCGILATSPTSQTCVDTNSCGLDQVCFADIEGDPPVCQDMLTACRPLCRADTDCADDQFCNFASGFCTAMQPPGLPIGALCNPNLPPEQDECNGFCLATDETSTEGTCAAFCSAGIDLYGCGWVGDGPADAACLYPTIISRDGAGGISLAVSDLMLCGGLCDCNDDCPAEAEYCVDENQGDPTLSINALFGRGGYCRPLIQEDGETVEGDTIQCE
jgi:hypothetical protein